MRLFTKEEEVRLTRDWDFFCHVLECGTRAQREIAATSLRLVEEG